MPRPIKASTTASDPPTADTQGGGSTALNPNKYLDIGLFADRLSLILKCYVKSPEAYNLPKEVLIEAREFFETAEKNGNNTEILVSEILDLLKTNNKVKNGKTCTEFCKESISILVSLLQNPRQVTSQQANVLKLFFDFLRDYALQNTPKCIDMGGYTINVWG